MGDETKAKCGTELFWHNCYKGSQDLYHSDAFQHPAKMAIPLAFRIMEHLKEIGFLKDEDVILDPMSGISTTGIVASALGHKFIGVELEDKFIELSKKNKEYAERKLYKGFDWQLIKGDSRRLSDLLKGQGLKSVVSPPYESSLNNTAEQKGWDKLANDPTSSRYGRKSIPSVGAEYSDNPDNIGNLKDTPLKSITSPPYMDAANPDHTADLEVRRLEIAKEKGISPDKVSHLDYTKTVKSEGYGETEGQIGKLKDKPLKSIVSPPYGETGVGDWKTGRAEFQAWVINEIQTKGYVEWQGKRYNEAEWRAMNHGRIDGRSTKGVHKHPTDGYSDNPDNIGGLPDRPLKSITSPPYTEARPQSSWEPQEAWQKEYKGRGKSYHKKTDGQIAALPDKPFKAITSPPYIDGKKGEIDADRFATHMENTDDYGDRHTEGRMKGIKSMGSGYSEDKENIGNLPDKPLKAITSPPYEQSITGGKSGIEWQEEWGKPSESRQPSQDISYGESKENIGNLKDKPLKSIVSPPYGDAELDIGIRPNRWEKIKDNPKFKGRKKWADGGRPSEYSGDTNNIGNLSDKPLKSIVSPPYGDAEKRDRSKEASGQKEQDYPRGDHNISAGYQGSDENIGKLADKPLKSVVSPPYGLGKGTGHSDNKRDSRPILKDRNVNLAYNDENPDNIGNLSDKPLKSVMSPPYGEAVAADYTLAPTKGSFSDIKLPALNSNYDETEGQIGQEKSESYLSAMSKVYREISLVSDVLCVVVKNPTRNGKIRRLDSDTISILEASGWRIHCQHRALLFEELEQADMFAGSKKQVKGRLSFFKRLSWQNGNPVASWEDILVCTRK